MQIAHRHRAPSGSGVRCAVRWVSECATSPQRTRGGSQPRDGSPHLEEAEHAQRGVLRQPRRVAELAEQYVHLPACERHDEPRSGARGGLGEQRPRGSQSGGSAVQSRVAQFARFTLPTVDSAGVWLVSQRTSKCC